MRTLQTTAEGKATREATRLNELVAYVIKVIVRGNCYTYTTRKKHILDILSAQNS